MNHFAMNGLVWHVMRVPKRSPLLVDRTNKLRVATTDPKSRTIYLSDQLSGEFLITVLLHELGHVVIFSYDLTDDIRRMVHPDYWIEAEEWICNFVADYGRKIFAASYSVLGDAVWDLVSYEIDKLVS